MIDEAARRGAMRMVGCAWWDAALRLRSGTGMINEAVAARGTGRGGVRTLTFNFSLLTLSS